MHRRGFLAAIGLGTIIANTIGSKELILPIKIEEQVIDVIINLREGQTAIYKDSENNIIESPAVVEEDLSNCLNNLIKIHCNIMGHPPKYIYLDGFCQIRETSIKTLEIAIVWAALSSDGELEYLFSEHKST